MTLPIVQISDTHISTEAPGRLQDLENCIQKINELPEQPLLVIHTGDVAHDGKTEEYHSAKQSLDKLRAPYYVMVGNRDKRRELINEFIDDSYLLPAEGWVQYSVEQHNVRLIMVDTQSDQSNKGQLCDGRLRHLESLLSANTSKPTALFLHHPPYEAVGIPDPFQYENWQDVEKLAVLLSQYSNLCGMYCGHVHRFIDGTISGVHASALSCLAGDLRKGEVTDSERKLPVFKELRLPG